MTAPITRSLCSKETCTKGVSTYVAWSMMRSERALFSISFVVKINRQQIRAYVSVQFSGSTSDLADRQWWVGQVAQEVPTAQLYCLRRAQAATAAGKVRANRCFRASICACVGPLTSRVATWNVSAAPSLAIA